MNDAEDFDAVLNGSIEDQHLLEIAHAKQAESLQFGEAEFGIPSHLGLGRTQRKSFVGGNEESVAEFWARYSRVVERLIVEVLVGLGANDVTCFNERVPVRFSRSSRRRCFSFQ